MTVKEIVKKYLEENGFDGLYCDDCGCKTDDLIPCDNEGCLDCQPGYKNPYTPDDEEDDLVWAGNWRIGPEKPKK